jgi:hypothetical protein
MKTKWLNGEVEYEKHKYRDLALQMQNLQRKMNQKSEKTINQFKTENEKTTKLL